MNGKKLICLLLCMVMCFTLLSGPWRAEAEAAAIAIPATVLGIVGLFVVSAGYSFESVGDFRTAVTDFCNKNFNMTNGSGFMDILRIKAPDAAGLIELGSVISSEYFPDFWQAIKDFFGGGGVEVESLDGVPEGFAIYNGVTLPILNEYSSSHPVRIIEFNETTGKYHQAVLFRELTLHKDYSSDYGYYIFRCNSSTSTYYTAYYYSCAVGDSSWTYEGNTAGSPSFSFYVDGTDRATFPGIMAQSKFIWTSHDIGTIIEGTEPFFGEVVIENVPVGVESTYNPTAVYNGWMSRVEAEPWMTYDATSAVFQDITTAETDKSAPMTVTQTGVLSQGGVKVETETGTVTPEYNGEYAVNGLTSIFPFCIPFDVYDFFSVLVAEREAPKFDFNLNFGKLGQYPISVDLTGWNTAATILRTIELLAFCVGLALATAKLIKW